MKRLGQEWTVLRFGLALFGWFVVTFAPLNQAGTAPRTYGQSLWVKHLDLHGPFLLVAVAFFVLAVLASLPGTRATAALLVVAAVVLLGGLAVSVTAFVPYLPFLVAILLARVAPRRRARSRAAAPPAAPTPV